MENYLKTLSQTDLMIIEGGTFWNDVSYGLGYISGKIYHIATTGSCNQVWQRW